MSAHKVTKAQRAEKPWKLFAVYGSSSSPDGFTVNCTTVAARAVRVALKAGRSQFISQNPNNWGFVVKAIEVEQRMINLVSGGAKKA